MKNGWSFADILAWESQALQETAVLQGLWSWKGGGGAPKATVGLEASSTPLPQQFPFTQEAEWLVLLGPPFSVPRTPLATTDPPLPLSPSMGTWQDGACLVLKQLGADPFLSLTAFLGSVKSPFPVCTLELGSFVYGLPGFNSGHPHIETISSPQPSLYLGIFIESCWGVYAHSH